MIIVCNDGLEYAVVGLTAHTVVHSLYGYII